MTKHKIPFWNKIAFAMADFAKSIAVALQVIFQLYFYVNVVGMDAGIAATIILIAKIWDIVDDFAIGALLDKTKAKEGPCRFWIKLASVPAGVVITLMLFVPELSQTGQIIWVAVMAILQVMLNSALVIPLNTLHGKLTNDPVERTHIAQIKGFFSQVSMMLIQAVTLPFVMSFGDDRKGFLIYGIILGVAFIICNLIAYWGTKGYEADSTVPAVPTAKAEEPAEEKLTLKENLKATLANTPWILTIVMYFATCISSCLISSTMAYYYQYYMKNINLMSIVSTISFAAIMGTIALQGIVVKKLGTTKTAIFGLCGAILGYLIRLISHDTSVILHMVGVGAVYFFGGFFSSTILLIIFETQIYGEWKTGIKNRGTLTAGYSMAYKIGMAIGTPLAGYLIAAVGFVPGAAAQEAGVLNLFFGASVVVPLCMEIISLLVCIVLQKKYLKRMPQITEELEARNRAAEQA